MVNPAMPQGLDPIFLREINLLEVFSDQELAQLISLGTLASYEPQANIVIEGEMSWGLYLILAGHVNILKNNKLTNEAYEVGHLRAGNFFGEMSLVDEQPRSATVCTLTPCQVFCLTKDAFMEFLNRAPDLKTRFYENCARLLVHRLRDLGDNYVISQYPLWFTSLKKESA
jgi:CRP-like cAMP-binding protein